MGRLIRVKPAAGLRREFAQWARRHRGVRTVSHAEIGLPPAVFAEAPERLLTGALVDSRPYVPRPAAPLRSARPQPQPARPAAVATVAPAAVVEPTVTDPDAPLPDGVQPPDDTGPAPVDTAVAGADHVVMDDPDSTVDDHGPALYEVDGDDQHGSSSPEVPEQHDTEEGAEQPTFVCAEPGCGFTSRSDRGLRIHQGRAHPGGGVA